MQQYCVSYYRKGNRFTFSFYIVNAISERQAIAKARQRYLNDVVIGDPQKEIQKFNFKVD